MASRQGEIERAEESTLIEVPWPPAEHAKQIASAVLLGIASGISIANGSWVAKLGGSCFLLASLGMVISVLARIGRPRLRIDDAGIRFFDGPFRPLMVPWHEIAFVCPTPFHAPSEHTPYERRLYEAIRLPEPTHVSFYLRLRDPNGFWDRAGRSPRGAELQIESIPLRSIPVPLDALYRFMRSHSEFELVVFDWPD